MVNFPASADTAFPTDAEVSGDQRVLLTSGNAAFQFGDLWLEPQVLSMRGNYGIPGYHLEFA
jgi:hypothetical protein